MALIRFECNWCELPIECDTSDRETKETVRLSLITQGGKIVLASVLQASTEGSTSAMHYTHADPEGDEVNSLLATNILTTYSELGGAPPAIDSPTSPQ